MREPFFIYSMHVNNNNTPSVNSSKNYYYNYYYCCYTQEVVNKYVNTYIEIVPKDELMAKDPDRGTSELLEDGLKKRFTITGNRDG